MAAFSRLGRALLLALVTGLAIVALAPSPLLAQQSEMPVPPEPDAIVVEDPLTTANIATVGVCPTARTLGENVGEGFIIKVRGRCRPTDQSAEGISTMRGLIIADGEVAVDFWIAQ